MSAADAIVTLTGACGLVWVGVVLALRVGLGRISTCGGNSPPFSSPPETGGENSSRTTLAILVAARNEERNIARCLNALARQDHPVKRREIVVIDDGSTDRTAEIAREYVGRIQRLRIINLPPLTPPLLRRGGNKDGILRGGESEMLASADSSLHSGKKRALETGIRASQGEIILTTDADCVPPPGWASGMAGLFEEGVDAVVGYSPLAAPPSIPPREPGGRIASWVARFDAFVNAVVSAGSIGLGMPSTAVGRNFAYRRSAWERAGGFSGGASGDDDLLLQSISRSGGKVRFSTDLGTYVPAIPPATLGNWLRAKRRHLSAGKRYHWGFVLLAGTLYLFNAGLVATAVLAVLGAVSWLWLAALVGIKAASDGLTLWKGSQVLKGASGWVLPWLVGEVVSPLLFTLLVPAALTGKVAWKGRELPT